MSWISAAACALRFKVSIEQLLLITGNPQLDDLFTKLGE